ncbi:hypothetical protein Pst134EA_031438 [Puccinia striiformis f. sp. tritici]|uniref:uncharacterized protein n=1 Tax=Puccinia striiformis f. sp. tritici TaxID=168172 RepID=UPI0020074AC9|nr:uncharacterized protein Pst134EA_031438 [Puccinia striiformis f. sp. tritici]KAH9440766.1 hypothetical protein Pst134EA_031438 [Puccinia striiformis f. sp. tritici]
MTVRKRVLQNLYFYVGNSRKEAISKATDALKKSPESFKKLLTPERGVSGQADYDRIEAALNSLVKGGFFSVYSSVLFQSRSFVYT